LRPAWGPFLGTCGRPLPCFACTHCPPLVAVHESRPPAGVDLLRREPPVPGTGELPRGPAGSTRRPISRAGTSRSSGSPQQNRWFEPRRGVRLRQLVLVARVARLVASGEVVRSGPQGRRRRGSPQPVRPRFGETGSPGGQPLGPASPGAGLVTSLRLLCRRGTWLDERGRCSGWPSSRRSMHLPRGRYVSVRPARSPPRTCEPQNCSVSTARKGVVALGVTHLGCHEEPRRSAAMFSASLLSPGSRRSGVSAGRSPGPLCSAAGLREPTVCTGSPPGDRRRFQLATSLVVRRVPWSLAGSHPRTGRRCRKARVRPSLRSSRRAHRVVKWLRDRSGREQSVDGLATLVRSRSAERPHVRPAVGMRPASAS